MCTGVCGCVRACHTLTHTCTHINAVRPPEFGAQTCKNPRDQNEFMCLHECVSVGSKYELACTADLVSVLSLDRVSVVCQDLYHLSQTAKGFPTKARNREEEAARKKAEEEAARKKAEVEKRNAETATQKVSGCL
jgi:hypothetical protein